MLYPKKHINRADGANASTLADAVEGPYAFKTLWQELTNTVGVVGNTIINGIQVTEKTQQMKDLYDIKGRQDWSLDYIEATKSNNTGTTAIFALVIAAALGALIYVAVKKQSK